MILAASVRTARRFAGDQVAARALYHAAWQFFENRWLNIAPRPLRAHPVPEEASTGQDEALAEVIEAIETIQIREVGRLVREYLHRGFDGDCLLRELGQTILKDDNGWHILNGLRTVSEEWSRCADPSGAGTVAGGASSLGYGCAAQYGQSVGRANGAALCPRRNRSGAVRVAEQWRRGIGLGRLKVSAGRRTPDGASQKSIRYPN